MRCYQPILGIHGLTVQYGHVAHRIVESCRGSRRSSSDHSNRLEVQNQHGTIDNRDQSDSRTNPGFVADLGRKMLKQAVNERQYRGRSQKRFGQNGRFGVRIGDRSKQRITARNRPFSLSPTPGKLGCHLNCFDQARFGRLTRTSDIERSSMIDTRADNR